MALNLSNKSANIGLLSNSCALVVLAGLLTWAPALVSGTFTYDRWDNLEYYAPIIKWAHGLLLEGHFPRVNLHQHLGEPFATNVQAGLHYPVYFAAVWLTKWLALGDPMLLALILVANLSIGIGGFVLLARELGLPTPLALTLAVGSQAGAYAMAYAGVWIFVTSVNAWMPWCVLGLQHLLAGKARGGVQLVIALGMIGWVGHPQFWVYAIAFLGVLAAIWTRLNPMLLLKIAPYFVAGALLASPAMLPVALFKAESTRPGALALDQFLAVSADLSSIMGMMTPLIRRASRALSQTEVSILTYQGPLAVVLLVIAIWSGKQERYANMLWATLLTTVLFLLMALGGNTPVYPMTYGLPLWSSFRWPAKFLLFVQFGVSVLAIFGFKRALQTTWAGKRALFTISLLNILVWLMVLSVSSLRSPVFPSPASIGVAATAVGSLVLLPHAQKRKIQWAMCGLSVLSSISFNALIHDVNLKKYAEGYLDVDYGFSDTYRVMPTSEDGRIHPYRLGRLNLGLAATVHNYLSLTGYTHPVVPRRYSDLIPSGIFGGIPRDWIRANTANRMLDFFGVRYILVHLPEDQKIIEATGKYKISRVQGDVTIYENPQAQPLAFFATETVEFTDWNRPPDVVRAEDTPIRIWGKGTISDIRYLPNGDIEIGGSTARESLVVITTLFAPGWQVSVNEDPYSAPLLVNDIVMGSRVPPGEFKLKLTYSPPGYLEGWLLALAGLMLASIALYGHRRGNLRHRPAGKSRHLVSSHL